jgi:ribonuclease BN (tRNA processing enzyme)
MHLDHVLGLPSVIMEVVSSWAGDIGQDKPAPRDPLRIFGPPGLRQWLEAVLAGTRYSRPGLFEVYHLVSAPSPSLSLSSPPLSKFDIPATISASGYKEWVLNFAQPHGAKQRVTARHITHSVECFGFTLQEADKIGSVDMELLTSLGVKPGPHIGQLKTNGVPIKLPDGRVITPEMAVTPTSPGRKVTIISDSVSASAMFEPAMGSDLVIHESSYTSAMHGRSRERKHSTSINAARFAVACKAHALALTHLSSECSPTLILNEAKAFATRHGVSTVFLATDMLEVSIPRQKRPTSSSAPRKN